MSVDGAEIYKLVERLLQLQGADFAFRARIEQLRREVIESERRYAEEAHRVCAELHTVKKALREKLGVPEPVPSTNDKSGFGDISDLFSKFNGIFGDDLKTPSCDPAGPDGPPCG